MQGTDRARLAGGDRGWDPYPEMLKSTGLTRKGVDSIISCFGVALCVVYVVGRENVRKRPATSEETTKMEDLLREARVA